MALANQGETVLAWDRRTGRPLTPAIVWQDRRSAGVCARLAGQADGLAAITGLPLDPYFAAPKMTWLRENLTADGVVTTTDTWLLARLGAGYVTDAATASRTMLLDLDTADWSERACEVFGLSPAALPAVSDCAEVVGETAAFGPPVPVAGLAVDQQAALLGQHCLQAGQAKCTYGTGAFLLAATGRQRGQVHRGPVRLGRLAAGRHGRLLPGRPGLHGRLGGELADPARRRRRGRRPGRPRRRRCPTAAACGSCPRWPAWARRTGARTPAARSSA